MSVAPSDIRFYKSGPQQVGGSPGAEIRSAILHEVFDAVSGKEARIGMEDYRCIYVFNHSKTSDLENAIIYLGQMPINSEVSVQLGIGESPVGVDEPEAADETTAPANVNFSDAIGPASGLSIGTLPANGGFKAVWIKRMVTAGADPQPNDRFTLHVLGETA